MVHGHQLDRWSRKDMLIAVRSLSQHHSPEGEQIVDG